MITKPYFVRNNSAINPNGRLPPPDAEEGCPLLSSTLLLLQRSFQRITLPHYVIHLILIARSF